MNTNTRFPESSEADRLAKMQMTTVERLRNAAERMQRIKDQYQINRINAQSETSNRREAEISVAILKRQALEELGKIRDEVMPLVADDDEMSDALYYSAQSIESSGTFANLVERYAGSSESA